MIYYINVEIIIGRLRWKYCASYFLLDDLTALDSNPMIGRRTFIDNIFMNIRKWPVPVYIYTHEMVFWNIYNFDRARVIDEKIGEYGWVHLRQSVHNPNVALNLQSSIDGGCQAMAKALLDKYAILYIIIIFLFYILSLLE